MHYYKTYDVRAECCELNGKGSDGAYSLIDDDLTAEEICDNLLKVLKSNWGLTNAGPCRLSIHITPAGLVED